MSRRERQRRRQRNKGGPHRIIFLALGLVFTGVVIAGIVAVAWVINVANSAPSLDTKKPIELGATSRIYAADGTRLGFINANILRTPVNSADIPEVVRQATVAIEDRRFYEHKGLGVKHNRYYTAKREGYVFDYVKQYLIDRYGLDTVRRGGLRIDTTIDLRLQKLARKAMDGSLGAPDRVGAIVTVDPKTGWVKAMASSSQYGDSKYNLAAQGHRQAGSTFKVMVLMDALRRGVDPNRTFYVSRPLEPGWLPTAPDYEVHTFGRTYR